MTDIYKTLAEREARYGNFTNHARVTREIISLVMMDGCMFQPGVTRETGHVIHEALHMIAHKLGRIAAGDPTYIDSWHDIAGYATLVERHLTAMQEPTDTPCDTSPPDAAGDVNKDAGSSKDVSRKITKRWAHEYEWRRE